MWMKRDVNILIRFIYRWEEKYQTTAWFQQMNRECYQVDCQFGQLVRFCWGDIIWPSVGGKSEY